MPLTRQEIDAGHVAARVGEAGDQTQVTDFIETFFTCVDVTEEFPFLVTKMSTCL
jgi:hypothetical protein